MSIDVRRGGIFVKHITCDRTSSRETDNVQHGDDQEGCQDRRSDNSCTNTSERNETDWTKV